MPPSDEGAPVDAPREPAIALPMIAPLWRETADSPALCAIGLSKYYGGVRAVEHVSFAVPVSYVRELLQPQRNASP